MKKLVCEMCESTDFIKEDGVFVCQDCGMKYSLEDAKKMMAEVTSEEPESKTVVVSGVPTTIVPPADPLKELYEFARYARANNTPKVAQETYEKILGQNPEDWEAFFFSHYYRAANCVVAEIESEAKSLQTYERMFLQKVRKCVADSEERERIVAEIGEYLSTLGLAMYNSAHSSWTNYSYEVQSKYQPVFLARALAVIHMLLAYGDLVETDYGGQLAIPSWKAGLRYLRLIKTPLKGEKKKTAQSLISGYEAKIKKYDPTYEAPKGGCYVATAVYGSYDCPEVWTLRRYRDDTLAKTWYGRAFIKTYYAISPTLVKWFGHTEWFKTMWRGKLNRMVQKLQNNGVENTPYEDKNW